MTLQPARALTLGVLFLLLHQLSLAQAPVLAPIASGTTASIRGLSVANDSIVWASGTGGTVGRSLDGGKSWEWHHTTGFDSCDWRSITALDEVEAYVLNAGSPAYLLFTYDGGYSWTTMYTNTDSTVFFDSMLFSDSLHAFAIGDPADGYFRMLYTNNHGSRWFTYDHDEKEFPKALPGEAIFAASNSNLGAVGELPRFITGGSVSRYFSTTRKRGRSKPLPVGSLNLQWQVQELPMLHGDASTGAFAMDFHGNNGAIVGGDYKNDTLRKQNAVYTTDGGLSWKPAETLPFGYRSGVAFLNMNRVAATGTSGTDFSEDGGRNWQHLSQTGYNTVKSLGGGHTAVLAGAHGHMALLTFPGR